jgi:diguanylate cyclase (GGDEF)-like protein
MGQTVLVVEDEFLIARDIRRALLHFGYDVFPAAATGADALEAAARLRPDVVLMDIRLRGSMDGIQTAARLQEAHHVPVVYLTAHSDTETLARAKATGPYGYVVKPFRDAELCATIEVALGRHELESKAAANSTRLAAANTELTLRNEERKHESERLLEVARTDPLSEAANRLFLQQDLEGIVDRAARYGHQYCAGFCDIDSFKTYNDAYGHLAGDAAIRLVSHEFRKVLRKGDGFYRYGGDEFLVLLPEQSQVGAWDCMDRVRRAVASARVGTDGQALARQLTISVGIADLRLTRDEDPIQSWLFRADAALYRAKERGKNCVHMSGHNASPLPFRIATPPPPRGPEKPLTSREREVLQLVAEGKSSKEIATALTIAVPTVESHRRQITEKLDLRTTAELTKYAIREGLTSAER